MLRIAIGVAATVGLMALVMGGCREPSVSKGQDTAAPASAPATTAAATSVPARPTVAVRRERLRRYAPAVGNFRARRTSKLGPQVSGRVEEVLVDVGERVKAGQVLVRLDPRSFEVEVRQGRAAVDSKKGALDSAVADETSAEREMRRQLELFEKGAGSTKERDDAVTAYERAVANRAEKAGDHAEAQRKLELAQVQLAETEIHAPYDGAITCRMVDPGEPAASTPPTHLLEIQEVGVLYLEFSLPQELLAKVKEGTALEFDVEGVTGGHGTASVAVVFPAVDEATRAFRCRAVIDNGAGTYHPGLLARVRVVADEVPDALVVPRTAVSQTGAGWQALVATEGQPVPRAVELGLLTDEWAQVLSGLKEGERVVAGVGGRS